MPKPRKVEATVHLRDLDWVATGRFTPGSDAYWDRSVGVTLPGDSSEVEDVELAGDGHDGALDYDDLSVHERESVDEAITLAALD